MVKSEPVPQEIIDWREALSNPKSIEKTMQEIVKAMSNGFDVSPLFSDVLKHMQTTNLKLKKLIYIFLTSNAYQNSNYTLLVVNGVENDSHNESPFIRALAIRAMGAIVTADVAEHFCQSFTRFASDLDPFVRKTTCPAIAKLYKVNPQLCTDTNLVQVLRSLIFDSNTAVVSAATASLVTVYSSTHQTIFSAEETNQLLLALSTANEWSAQTILSAISQFSQISEPQIAIQQITPFLQHANPAVSLSAINLMNKFGQNSESSIVSLISQASSSEVQFVAMRALRLAMVHKESFSRNLKLFYVNFKDEIYVKLEKIELLASFATLEVVQDIINELTEYCQDVNDQIVRKSLYALAKIACNVPQSADMVVQTFILLLTGKNAQKDIQFRLQPYAAQELLVQIQMIFRAFPDRYEGVIGELTEAIVQYDDYRAKSALIWILGEYSDRIEGVEEVILDLFDQDVKTVKNEHCDVQFSLLNASAKVYLSNQKDATQTLFLDLVDEMKKSDEPGVRQRANYLSKLFKMDPTLQLAKSVIYVQKSIPVFTDGISPVLQSKLVQRLGSVEATMRQVIVLNNVVGVHDADDVVDQFQNAENEQPTPTSMQQQIPSQISQPPMQVPTPPMQQQDPAPAIVSKPVDLLDDVMGGPPPKQAQQKVDLVDDIFGFDSPTVSAPATASAVAPVFNAPNAQQQVQQAAPVQQQSSEHPNTQTPQGNYMFANCPVRPKDQSYPLKLVVGFTRINDSPVMLVQIKNTAQTPIMKPTFVFQSNAFGIQAQELNIPVIPALNMFNQGKPVQINFVAESPSNTLANKFNMPDLKLQSQLNVLTFQVNTSQGTSYFYQVKLPISIVFNSSGFWHKSRLLTDFNGAQNVLSQSNQWPEFIEIQNVFFGQLQATDFSTSISSALMKLQEANFLLIQTTNESADLVINSTILGQQVIAVTNVSWQLSHNLQSVDFRVVSKVQASQSLVGQFVVNAAAQVVSGK
ncbi:Beta adaptin [Spironucleus salmonicida]|uniref:Beta adaptin n=1 Tax=Spironucleus salmonicida TaxID=348837 RepID=V6LGQ5_9EUKA|nr:Beta adaptin [Spironucleus salmonicida]|eukprot:EST43493.1 Beta adaptin [Spironucleus salmonicida]